MVTNSKSTAYRTRRPGQTGGPTCVALLLAMLLTAGCAGPGYYAQAVAGQWKMLRSREDISALLANGRTDPDLARRLETIQRIRTFAQDRLALPAADSYTTFVHTGRDAATWNVVAAPEFSLEPRRWCFIVAGCVPYRGYFKEDAARRFAAKMSRRGDDVAISPAVAYSTLGWFDDPVLDTMLDYPEEQIAGLLFHELTHRKLYIKGDTAFNESYASFVEETGVRLWLKRSGNSDRLRAWRHRAQAETQFNRLTREARDRLARIYASEAPAETMRVEKSEVLDALKIAYARLVSDDWGGRNYFAGWMDKNVNNAGLALLDSYRGGMCAFADLYRQASHDMERFHALAMQKADLPAAKRRAWLEQPCGVIAPDGDL
ncbi:MAG: aminopeptidase [Lysobacterales bacterium]